MTDLTDAARLLDVPLNALTPFDDRDPFSGCVLAGGLCQIPDRRYGALAILTVDDRPAEQVIHATPKMHYPFFARPDGSREYRFPVVREAVFMEKIDGTNIFAYRFRDADGADHVTYKTRLVPVLKASRWGDWIALWQSMLDRYPAIPDLVRRNDAGLSFELYGAANPHLVHYTDALDIKLLFGVTPDGRVRRTDMLETDGVPLARTIFTARSAADLPVAYEQLRDELTAENAGAAEGVIVTEGLVVYCTLLDDTVVQYKLKPSQVEEIHFAAGAAINIAIIRQAVLKAVESGQPPAADPTAAILAEDWDERAIDRARPLIDQVVERVAAELAFRDTVLTAYHATGLSFTRDRAAVMRALSPQFDRSKMGLVYALVAIANDLHVK